MFPFRSLRFSSALTKVMCTVYSTGESENYEHDCTARMMVDSKNSHLNLLIHVSQMSTVIAFVHKIRLFQL